MRFLPVRAVLAAAVMLLAVSAPAAPAPTPLSSLCDEYWQGYLRMNPLDATSVGDTRYDAKLEDITPAGIERERAFYQRILERARDIDAKSLSASDRVTRGALIEEMEDRLALISCHLEEWMVDPQNGPQVEFMNLPQIITIRSPKSARDYVSRCRAMARYFDDHVANLRVGLAHGRTASRDAVKKTIDELGRLVAQPVDSLPIMVVARTE